MSIYSFHEKLQGSFEKEGAFDRIYWTYFKNVADIERIDRFTEMDKQRIGLDTNIVLQSGERIRAQEKWRERRFTGDFLIEYCSVWKDGECKSPGWIYSCDADYIFCAYELSDLVKIYPVVQLKIAWANNKTEWQTNAANRKSKFKRIVSETERYGVPQYQTFSIAVPCDILEEEIRKTMRFDFQRKLNEVTA